MLHQKLNSILALIGDECQDFGLWTTIIGRWTTIVSTCWRDFAQLKAVQRAYLH